MNAEETQSDTSADMIFKGIGTDDSEVVIKKEKKTRDSLGNLIRLLTDNSADEERKYKKERSSADKKPHKKSNRYLQSV